MPLPSEGGGHTYRVVAEKGLEFGQPGSAGSTR